LSGAGRGIVALAAGAALAALIGLGGCDPYADWPEEGAVFSWVYTPEEG